MWAGAAAQLLRALAAGCRVPQPIEDLLYLRRTAHYRGALWRGIGRGSTHCRLSLRDTNKRPTRPRQTAYRQPRPTAGTPTPARGPHMNAPGLTVHLTVHLTIHPTIHLTIHLTIHPTIHPTIHLTVHLTVHRTVQVRLSGRGRHGLTLTLALTLALTPTLTLALTLALSITPTLTLTLTLTRCASQGWDATGQPRRTRRRSSRSTL